MLINSGRKVKKEVGERVKKSEYIKPNKGLIMPQIVILFSLPIWQCVTGSSDTGMFQVTNFSQVLSNV